MLALTPWPLGFETYLVKAAALHQYAYSTMKTLRDAIKSKKKSTPGRGGANPHTSSLEFFAYFITFIYIFDNMRKF
jgi:hypothetical protein